MSRVDRERMILGTHAIIYAQDAEQARAFFRDVLELPHVDAHDGWLIYQLPPAELGIHPTEQWGESSEARSGHHELFLMCDDVEQTVADLQTRGVEFTAPIEQAGFGMLTRFRVPGAGEMGLYQPRHATALDL